MGNQDKVFNPKKMSKLEHPDRYKELPPAMILETLSVEEGHVFGDFGCGIGFFSIPAAEMVGDSGRVIAVDISREMLDGLQERLPASVKARVELVLSGTAGDEDAIEAESLDRAMISTVLHEVDESLEFLSDVAKTLKPGGKLAVVEWVKKEMLHGPGLDIRISEAELEDQLSRAGFSHEKTIQLSERFYLMIAVKN